MPTLTLARCFWPQVCGTFKSVYFEYKSKAGIESPNNPWRVQNTSLFPYLDAFLERCHDVLDLFKTITQVQRHIQSYSHPHA